MKFVAFGDSVVWGQGLPYEEKFVVKAARAIAQRRGVPFNAGDLSILAHSGAVIDADLETRTAFTRLFPQLFLDASGRTDAAVQKFKQGQCLDEKRWLPGELSVPFPTILEQMDHFASHDVAGIRGNVDVVFVDGGGNDLDFTHFIDPNAPSEGGDFAFAESTLRDRYRRLVEKAQARFPRAVIIVLGFYPLISHASSTEGMREFFYFESGTDKKSQTINNLQYNPVISNLGVAINIASVGLIGALFNLFSGGLTDIDALISKTRDRVWSIYNFGSKIAREAVFAASNGQAIFCEAPLGSANALFAPRSTVVESFDPERMTDALASERQRHAGEEIGRMRDAFARNLDGDLPREAEIAAYEEFLEVRLRDWRRQSFLHPATAGAEAYARAIVHAYETNLEGSVRKMILPAGGGLRAQNHIKGDFSLAWLRVAAPIDVIAVQWKLAPEAQMVMALAAVGEMWLAVKLKNPRDGISKTTSLQQQSMVLTGSDGKVGAGWQMIYFHVGQASEHAGTRILLSDIESIEITAGADFQGTPEHATSTMMKSVSLFLDGARSSSVSDREWHVNDSTHVGTLRFLADDLVIADPNRN